MSSNPTEWRPWVIVVGGFLGAGKTSLILSAAAILEKRGLRCAVVLNDQGEDLVDTRHVKHRGIPAHEVVGGCFCCRFTDLLFSFEKLRDYLPDVIFAEPVGSCTDIVATVLRPLYEDFALCRVAPFTVLVDPARLAMLLSGEADEDIEFLMRKQMQEADLVCLTKADLHPEITDIPGMQSLRLSARSGAGVEEWLDQVLTNHQQAGGKVLEIDYRRYAQAEAALAWLNLNVLFQSATPLSPVLLVGPLLDRLDEVFSSTGISIAHLKLIDRSPAGWVKAATCTNGGAADVEGDLDAGPALQHELTLNLRAVGAPAQLQEIVERQIRSLAGEVLDWRMNCFSPPPPVPQRRIAHLYTKTPSL